MYKVFDIIEYKKYVDGFILYDFWNFLFLFKSYLIWFIKK